MQGLCDDARKTPTSCAI